MNTNEQMNNAIPTDLPGGMDGVEPNDTETDAAAPQIGMGEWNPLEIPEIGISFRRFYSSSYDKYIAAWNDGNNSHVYELVVQSQGDGWEAIGMNDGGTVFQLQAPSRHLVRRIACASMRAYLTRGHRKTWSKARAAAKEVA